MAEQLQHDEQDTRELEAVAEAPDPVRYNDRVLILGKTESGKTVLAKHLFSTFTGCRRTAIDVKGGMELGVAPARTPAELDLEAPVSHFIPSRLEDDEYEELFERLWYAGGPRVILLDESYGPTRAGYAPRGLRFIIQQGREPGGAGTPGIGLIACSQRPVNIESTLRTEAEHAFVFVPRPSQLDLKTLAPDLGCDPGVLSRELDALLREEGPHSHLWYCRRQDRFYRCAPLPPAWAS